MKSISVHLLLFILFLVFGIPVSVSAVTDAELEALEKQIEQREQEMKKQAEAEAQKKKAEASRKREEELKRIEEAEARRKAEEARLTGEERRRQEEEANKVAGEEAKKREEANRKAEEAIKKAEAEAKKMEEEAKKAEEEKRKQFSRLMRVADSAVNSKNYQDALELYTQALEIFPDDPEALAGQTKAREYQEVCTAIVGEWDWVFGVFVIISADGNLVARALISNTGQWECIDPAQRKFALHWNLGGWVDTMTLSEDNNTLDGTNNIGLRVQGWRKGTKKRDPVKEVPL